MHYTTTTKLTSLQKEQIRAIWDEVYPAQITHTSIISFEKYLIPLKKENHIMVLNNNNEVKGWLVTFDRDGDRWFAMLLDDTVQGQGIGSELMRRAQQQNRVLNGWVTDHNRYLRKDGKAYPSPLGFYIKKGFKILEERFEDKKLSLIKMRWET